MFVRAGALFVAFNFEKAFCAPRHVLSDDRPEQLRGSYNTSTSSERHATSWSQATNRTIGENVRIWVSYDRAADLIIKPTWPKQTTYASRAQPL